MTLALLVSLGAFGGFGYAASAGKKAVKAARSAVLVEQTSKGTPTQSAAETSVISAAGDQYQRKCLVRHRGNFIFVSEDALPAHLEHGDVLIFCEP
jgi:hypothetical protein